MLKLVTSHVAGADADVKAILASLKEHADQELIDVLEKILSPEVDQREINMMLLLQMQLIQRSIYAIAQDVQEHSRVLMEIMQWIADNSELDEDDAIGAVKGHA